MEPPTYGQSGPMGQPPTGPMGQPPAYGQTGPMGQPAYGQTGPMGSGGYMAAPVMVAQPSNKGLAIALEVIGGLFGFFGIGWLISRFTTPGLILLICGILGNIIMWTLVTLAGGLLAIFTFGLSFLLFLCPPVVNIIVMVISTIMLNGRLSKAAASGAPMASTM